MNEQQILNYLYWLKERGQVHLGGVPMPVGSNCPPTISTTLRPQPDVSISVRLLFISQDVLLDSESAMVERIAAALGLKLDDFRIITTKDFLQFSAGFIVTMGELADHPVSELAIPHPSEMIRDPQLKVSAWDRLLKLKAKLH